jgi:DNA-binding IclR family transcriptional regulator
MSDIVERLREKKVMVFKPIGDTGLVTSSLEIEPDAKEAADEIEKLRDEIFNLKTEVHFDDQTIKSLQEIEKRLREAVIEIVYRIGQGDTFGAMDIAAPIASAALKEK